MRGRFCDRLLMQVNGIVPSLIIDIQAETYYNIIYFVLYRGVYNYMNTIGKVTFISVLSSIILSSAVSAAVPNKKLGVLYGKNRYQICFEEGTPDEQEKLCEKAGGHLAVITNDAENRFVRSLIESSGNGQDLFVIGGSDADNEGVWNWVTGEPFDYANWAAGEPDNGGSAETKTQDFLCMDTNGNWHDFYGYGSNDILGQFVCEWENAFTYVTKVKMCATSLSFSVGSAVTLAVNVSPSNADNPGVKWSSSNPSIASVDKTTGKVFGIKEGKAIITATSVDGSKKTATCVVTIKPRIIKAKSISLPSTKKIHVGDKTKLTVSFTPGNATQQDVVWKSSNKKVATVSSKGVIKALSAGTTTISAVTTDGTNKKAKCTLTVKKPSTTSVTGLPTVKLYIGEVKVIYNVVEDALDYPAGTAWKSTDPLVVSAYSSGSLYGKKTGKAKIYVKDPDDGTKTYLCNVSVIAGPELSETSLTVPCTSTVRKLQLANATENVTWSCSNTDVAEIKYVSGSYSQTASIQVKHSGSTFVYARHKNKTFRCKLTVRPVFTYETSLPATTKDCPLVEENKVSFYVNTYFGRKKFYAYQQKAYKQYIDQTYGCSDCSGTTVYKAYCTRTIAGLTPDEVDPVNFRSVVYKSIYGDTKGFGLTLEELANILNYAGVKCSYVQVPRSEIEDFLKKELSSGYSVLIRTTYYDVVTGEIEAGETDRWAVDKHTTVLTGISEKNRAIVANSGYKSYHNRVRITFAPTDILRRVMVNDRVPEDKNYVTVVVTDPYL